MIGDLEQLGDGLLVRGWALVTLYRTIRHVQRDPGVAAVDHPARIKALESATRATLSELAGRQAAPVSADTGVDWLTTEQVAKRLEVGVRTVQRWAPRLEAELVGGTWRFPASRVEAEAAARRLRKEAS